MKKITLIALLLPFLSACLSSMPDVSKVIPNLSKSILYKDDVNQGSVLERFKINQLKIGMSKAQVSSIIGSPSVIDPFHNNQWDYINHSTLHNKNNIHYRLSLAFKNDKLININKDDIASLPALNEKQKALETARIIDEKTAAEALAKAKVQRVARQKAVAEAKAIEQQHLAEERAKALMIIKAKAERIARKKAVAEAKALAQERLIKEKPQTNKP